LVLEEVPAILCPRPTLPPQDFIKHKRLRLTAIAGFYPANAVGDDIELYEEDSAEGRAKPAKAKLFGLRQQVCV
jgi:5-methyltetrahydrofolate--homocysteine methyltransferase